MTELDTHIKRLKIIRDGYATQDEDAIDAVLEALETARKDSTRLAWLEDNSIVAPPQCEFSDNPHLSVQHVVWTVHEGEFFDTLREAIDAQVKADDGK